MIVYEVNQEMESTVFEDFKKWFVGTHVPEMLAIEGFIEARIFVDENTADNKRRTTCWYQLESQSSYDRYIENEAEEMRRRLSETFGDRVQLNRRVLSFLQTIHADSI